MTLLLLCLLACEPAPALARTPVPPPPSGRTGTLTVELPAGLVASHVEITDCGDPLRGAIVDGVVVVHDVPMDPDCRLRVLGEEPKQFRPVRGGDDLTCTLIDGALSCRPHEPRPQAPSGGCSR